MDILKNHEWTYIGQKEKQYMLYVSHFVFEGGVDHVNRSDSIETKEFLADPDFQNDTVVRWINHK